MELHGSLASNLELARASARRLRGHPVHRDTLAFWSELISEARARRAAGLEPDDPEVARLITDIETAIAEAKVDPSS